MTRETKIGLLVGLAFIIVVGILISDHISSTNEAPVASLQSAGSTLREGLGEPNDNDVQPSLRPPQAIVLRQSVPTHEEVASRSSHPAVTLANPGTLNLNPPTMLPQPAQPDSTGQSAVNPLRREALARGEDVTPLDQTGTTNATDPVSQPPIKMVPAPAQPGPKSTASSYKAQSGDTLGTIALHAYGTNNKANREAIVAANASLRSNRNLIVAGRAYNIPTAGARPVAAAPVAVANDDDATAQSADTGNVYVVQSGDTLWSIAVDEVGSSSAVATLKDLNQDVLGDSDRVRPNMKLRLPAKKVAVAN